jgi:hypothetical protein
MSRTLLSFGLPFLLGLGACASPPAEEPTDRLTLGKVQGEIKIGLDAASVVEILGSPNIVTTDDQRREVWVYDKISTDRVDTARSSFATLIILGASSASSTRSTRQRTLTIVIKFDEEKKVRDFSYNFTQF